MSLFGLRHTTRWAVHNAGEFDRRHLRSAGAWLFGRRPIRPTRPLRRIWFVLVWAAWLAIVTRSTPLSDILVAAGGGGLAVATLILTVVHVWPRIKARARGLRNRRA